jgi:uncharacterized membrane protein
MSYAELLARVPMFENLADDDRQALAQSLVERKFAAGEIIMNLGDRGTSMFIIAEGHVNIFLPGEASRRISLKDITTGEHLGEIALFDDRPRSASAIATTDATLLELDRDTLSRYLAQRPQGAMTLLRALAARLRATNEMLSQRAAKNVVAEFERKLTWSQKLADRVASLNGSWTFILLLVGMTLLWIVINAPALASFDPYPYVFFNLLLAILVALQGPLIVMSQNRSSLKDRAQAETDFQVNLKNEVNIETLLRELGEMRAEMNQRLVALETAQRRASA